MGARQKKEAWAVTPTPAMIGEAVREAFEGPAWHGPTVRSSLRGITWEEASWRLAPGRNTIWELVLHLAYVRHRMLGRVARVTSGRVPRFPRSLDGSWFPRLPEIPGAQAWRDDVGLLVAYQGRFLDALAGVDPSALEKRRKGADRSLGAELMGVAFHDVYHSGQIRLLSMLVREDEARRG